MGKLREQMKADLVLRGFSVHTQRNYLRCVREFAKHFKRSPAQMGEQEVRAFLLHLVQQRKVSAGLRSVYVSALKFFYRNTVRRPEVVEHIAHPKKPKLLPDVLTKEEVLAIFKATRSLKYKAIIATTYSAGLRISEVCTLRLTDINSKRMLIHIRCAKGNKDRYVMLSEQLVVLLRQYYKGLRRRGIYLFSGQDPNRPISTSAVHQVLKKAVKKAGLSKKVSMHTLRHCFATHFLEAGGDIRVVQVLLGHTSIRTTVRYTRVSSQHIGRTPSPWDLLHCPEDPTEQ
jgi:integrase/recombinase XerD